eukprot:4706513-Prymnesium_polylepis.3
MVKRLRVRHVGSELHRLRLGPRVAIYYRRPRHCVARLAAVQRRAALCRHRIRRLGGLGWRLQNLADDHVEHEHPEPGAPEPAAAAFVSCGFRHVALRFALGRSPVHVVTSQVEHTREPTSGWPMADGGARGRCLTLRAPC